jgi:pimeloyl-ACP methyl ester carboxylesterase
VNRRESIIALAAISTAPLLASAAHHEMKNGTVRTNGLDFAFVEMGTGPLALCLHGFPDSPWTYRYLMPALAAAGYRAVTPFMRGYAPTSIPADGRYDTGTLASDPNALHAALV